MLPDSRAAARRRRRRGLAADRADAGPGRGAAPSSACARRSSTRRSDRRRSAARSSARVRARRARSAVRRARAAADAALPRAARARRSSRCSRSTRRTACRNGATTSARSTCSSSVLHERFPGVPRIALTATADRADARRDRRSACSSTRRALFVSSFDRPNIRYRIVEKDERAQRSCSTSSATSTRARPASSIACRARRSTRPPRASNAQGIARAALPRRHGRRDARRATRRASSARTAS